ncbi:DUF4345 domain-containing protein [Vibrio coralliilyticus]|uniref:DUF4345 domain-containing protein n=1 Tax=Vibrio coralliilyticus TaxID=190893 RepID=UPI0024090B10|nr:DUF4345 domain-containing protein [Vibrio coralliilyticus]WFB46428.1 DUF4345 domain-containing protein [Vibrio coralliilyticus]
MSKGLILLTSAVFFFYGLAFAIAPNSMLSHTTGGYATSASMLVDIRATYGGMSVGVALILFLLSQKPSTLTMGLLAVIFVNASMATGRIIGLVSDGETNSTMHFYLMLEVGVSLLALYLFKSGKTGG